MSATDEAIKDLANLLKVADADPKSAHVIADKILLEYLRKLGKSDVADAWEALEDQSGFWYA